MKYLVIRHGKAGGTRLNRPLYGRTGASLTLEGYQQAVELRDVLTNKGIDVEAVKVAVSNQVRTRQTALTTGIPESHQIINPLLDEVLTADPAHTQELVEKGQLPVEAVVAAKALLGEPPKQFIWFTHGLVIAGMREVLGMPGFIPGYCEIVEIELST